jgi:archaellum component FlaC
MKEFFMSQIAPTISTIAVTAATAILVFVVKKVGTPITQLLIAKKQEAELKLKATGHESQIKQALEVWKVVDDKFRLSENASELFGSKAKLFEQLLLKKIPGLTQQNIDDLRDAISGEVNAGRKALSDDSATIVNQLKEQVTILKQANNQLASDKENLTKQIQQINGIISPNTGALASPNSTQND